MLNLVYRGTRDEDIDSRLSTRRKDRFDVFGALPDVIEADQIDDIELLDAKLSEFIDRKGRQNAFDIRYNSTIDAGGERWERCANVLSQSFVSVQTDFARIRSSSNGPSVTPMPTATPMRFRTGPCVSSAWQRFSCSPSCLRSS